MGLIAANTPAEDAADYIKAEIKSAVQHLEGAIISTFTRFWQDPSGADPQAILDAFGTNAATLVQVFAAGKDLVNLIKPNSITAEGPYSIVENEDGTATIAMEE
jgi:hypothetical protein